MSSSAAEGVRYKAILNPRDFDNAQFWKGIANYKGGRLEKIVIHAEKTVKSEVTSEPANCWFASSSPHDRICLPRLADMLYMLCGPRLGSGNSDDESAMKTILLTSIRPIATKNIATYINSSFSAYGGTSNQVIATERDWYSRTPLENTYPGFIGHKDFVVPQLRSRPISSAFWLSLLLMTAGTVAIICAFAFMQAASLAIGGTMSP